MNMKDAVKESKKIVNSNRKNLARILRSYGEKLTADEIEAIKFAIDFLMLDPIVLGVAVGVQARNIQANA